LGIGDRRDFEKWQNRLDRHGITYSTVELPELCILVLRDPDNSCPNSLGARDRRAEHCRSVVGATTSTAVRPRPGICDRALSTRPSPRTDCRR
jgi:hypothetical protein